MDIEGERDGVHREKRAEVGETIRDRAKREQQKARGYFASCHRNTRASVDTYVSDRNDYPPHAYQIQHGQQLVTTCLTIIRIRWLGLCRARASSITRARALLRAILHRRDPTIEYLFTFFEFSDSLRC